MRKLRGYLDKFSLVVLFLSFVVFSGCGVDYKTPVPDENSGSTQEEYITLPKSLGYSVKALDVSKGLYNNILISANDLSNDGVLSKEQVEQIVEVASRYKATHNTAQKAVSAWFVAYTMKSGEFDKNYAMSEVLKLVATAPEVINDVNSIIGDDVIKIPDFFNLDKLMDIINKDDSIDANEVCIDCK